MDEEEAQAHGEPAVLCCTVKATDGCTEHLHQTGR